jgi:isoprenylcysteine carboxyl methyltransferase (ICMT) family protein YpbQ
VALGFLAAVAALLLARPTPLTWWTGLIIAVAGEAVRIWAAGHLEKGSEITRSGPYRWSRHPLYVGSSIIAAGIVIASRSVPVGIVAAFYMGATITAAIRTEERLSPSASVTGTIGTGNRVRSRCRGGSAPRVRCATANTAPWPGLRAASRCLR